MLQNENRSKTDNYRRPYGVGVLPLNDYSNFDHSLEPEEKEHSFKLYTCDEKEFHQLHEAIIRKSNTKYSLINGSAGQNCNLVVSLKLINGGLAQAKAEQPQLYQGIAITKKMGFPDVIMPGDFRNDLFLSLVSGEFER